MAAEELQLGQIIELSDGRPAVVRFIGPTEFAPVGIWVGVELEDYSGKNDGSVKGERYFDCEPERGMFVRPSAVRIIEQPPPPPAAAPKSNGAVKKSSRPSSMVSNGATKRLSSFNDAATNKRASMNAPSPSPAARRPSSMLRSPTKSPTKQLMSAVTSTASTPRTSTPSNSRAPTTSTTRPSLAAKRTSMGPPAAPAARTSRPSLAPAARLSTAGSRTSFAPKAPGRPIPGRLTSVGSQAAGGGTPSEGSGQDTGDEDKILSQDASDGPGGSSKAISPALSRTVASEKATGSSAGSSQGPISPVTTRAPAATNREIEDLKAKLRLMEKKRMEDREKLKALDKVQEERNKFEGIIQKLQTKYQPQQQEITDLRKQLKESTSKFEDIENMQAEHDIALEMATLDREMAEETAEVFKTELEALKLKTEELELEVEVLREENTELSSEMSPEEKTSQGWLQMERNNERLREALLRLRDITQQTEADLRDEIKTLEEDTRELGTIKDHYETAKQKLAQSEASVEDLRQQLDNALGAEDMIEELTERNMSMSEQIEELKVTIEDLESLKELNDELEVNHVETEKEMQEELDFKDTVITEQARRAGKQEEALEDMEYTLSRFRELVTNLQTDLEDIKASHAVTETESEQLNSRTRAMQDLNMKLQVSAAKTQVKTIDLEMRRLDAQEASDHLAIVQLFLPDSFQIEKDSVLALLRFKRVAFKANLLQSFVKERISNQGSLGHEDDIFTACDVLDKLAWVTAMCDRFVNAISHCSVDQFAKFEGALYELEPVERALNGWIDGLRRDELKEQQCASELQRTIALMTHLSEVHIANGLESYADDVHMRALLMQSHLENTAAALSAAKTMVNSMVLSKDVDDELEQHFAKKTENVIAATRSAKVIVGKAVRALEDLKTRSLSLLPDTIQSFELCESGTQELAAFARQVGLDLFALLHEEGRAEAFTFEEVESCIHRTTSSVLASTDSDIFSTYNNKLRTLTSSLADLCALATDLSQTQEFERAPAPWILRSQDLKSSKTVHVDAQEEMVKLKEENRERLRLIAMRDQTLEEATVKIELLESRMRDAGKIKERIAELEKKLEEAKARETELTQSVESRDKDLLISEKERERWKKVAGEQKVVEVEPGSKAGMEKAVATAREMESLKSEIAALQAAIRYLREDNRLSKLSEPRNTKWLEEPLIKTKTPKQQKADLVVAEGNDVLNELLNLTKEAKIFDLNTLPKNRLAWRPVKSTPAYQVAKQREDWESWKSWGRDVVKKGEALRGRDVNAVLLNQDPTNKFAAKFQLRLPQLEAKGVKAGEELRIVDPEEFDGFRRGLGIAA